MKASVKNCIELLTQMCPCFHVPPPLHFAGCPQHQHVLLVVPAAHAITSSSSSPPLLPLPHRRRQSPPPRPRIPALLPSSCPSAFSSLPDTTIYRHHWWQQKKRGRRKGNEVVGEICMCMNFFHFVCGCKLTSSGFSAREVEVLPRDLQVLGLLCNSMPSNLFPLPLSSPLPSHSLPLPCLRRQLLAAH